MHYFFTIYLDDQTYSTRNTITETMNLLNAMGATGRVMAALEGR